MRPPTASPEVARAINEVLTRHDYTSEGVGDLLGNPSLDELSLGPSALEGRIGKEPGLPALVRLFALDQEVDVEVALSTIAPTALEVWIEAGLLERSGDAVRAPVGLVERAGFYIAADWSTPRGGVEPDHVLGVSNSSMTLARMTLELPPGRVLDLGCGSGIQSLLASRDHVEVVGSDSNPRAIAFARFNLALNGIDNATMVEGDLFDPVESQTFDLIVTNPPFVISPHARFVFRDSPLGGEGVCRAIVENAPRYLESGGYMQMLCNWEQRRGEPWEERLEAWFDAADCDGWVMRFESAEPDVYASLWLRQGEVQAGIDRRVAHAEWVEFFEKRDVESVGIGLITMRKGPGKRWYVARDAPDATMGRAGRHVLRLIEGQDILLSDDTTLLDMRLAPVPELVLQQQWEPGPGKWNTISSTLTVRSGVPFPGKIDAFGANLIASLSGKRTLREAIEDVAVEMGGEPAEAIPLALVSVREMIASGFLTAP